MAESQGILDIAARYYRVYTDADTPCDEENFHFVERQLPLPVAQTALVLVDVWATHYIDSWLKRAAAITAEKILPLTTALRAAGVTIIHAPSPFVVERQHPESMPTALQARSKPVQPAAERAGVDEWPPAAFHGLYRTGDYADFGRNQEQRLQDAHARYEQELKISPLMQPQPGDVVIATGEQMHEELRSRRILHLLYAGFATNWCVIGRDYGMIAMQGRGYNNVLVRDATTGVEFHDSVDELTATQITIREIETKYGWSTTCDELVHDLR